jgi:hypothetical protein
MVPALWWGLGVGFPALCSVLRSRFAFYANKKQKTASGETSYAGPCRNITLLGAAQRSSLSFLCNKKQTRTGCCSVLRSLCSVLPYGPCFLRSVLPLVRAGLAFYVNKKHTRGQTCREPATPVRFSFLCK